MSTDSRDNTTDMLKSIDEHAVVLQNNLHYKFCLQAFCYNVPVLITTCPSLPYLEVWSQHTLGDDSKVDLPAEGYEVESVVEYNQTQVIVVIILPWFIQGTATIGSYQSP